MEQPHGDADEAHDQAEADSEHDDGHEDPHEHRVLDVAQHFVERMLILQNWHRYAVDDMTPR